GDLHDLRRHVARRSVGADLLVDAFHETVADDDPLAQLDEEHDAHIVLPILADDQRLQHFWHLLHLAINLCRADAHAAGIEHRVRAAVDDEAAMLRLRGEIAVAPDTREPREIGVVVLAAIGIVPESDGHAGEGTAADELALFIHRRSFAVIGEDVNGHAEARCLNLAAPHRTD